VNTACNLRSQLRRRRPRPPARAGPPARAAARASG
jgi:hypothetical protein